MRKWYAIRNRPLYRGPLAWTPTDGSGAALAFTVTTAKYTQDGNAYTVQCHITYPATASGAASQINGLPKASLGIHCTAVYTSGAAGATVAQVSGTSINLYAPGNVAITNANLSGAFVILTFTYLT